ncbi:MAG: hypothetical protein HY698_07420 [Deltaproteobacteria bacterium]|nr:hypothetical protein [Deltaproteobacteria bacterium]
MGEGTFTEAARALRERHAAVLEKWLGLFVSSPLRLLGPRNTSEVQSLAEGVAGGLAEGLADPTCAPGSACLRDAEKQLAFVGGVLSAAGATSFDVMAFVLGLREALRVEVSQVAEREALSSLFDWLAAVTLEGACASRDDSVRLRHQSSLERGTPVVQLTEEIPAVMLVGEPERSVLESIFSRLLFAAVRVGARVVVIDGSGLACQADERVLDVLGLFARHGSVAGKVSLVMSGIGDDAEGKWREAMPASVETWWEERLDRAIQRALGLMGLSIQRALRA